MQLEKVTEKAIECASGCHSMAFLSADIDVDM